MKSFLIDEVVCILEILYLLILLLMILLVQCSLRKLGKIVMSIYIVLYNKDVIKVKKLLIY